MPGVYSEVTSHALRDAFHRGPVPLDRLSKMISYDGYVQGAIVQADQSLQLNHGSVELTPAAPTVLRNPGEDFRTNGQLPSLSFVLQQRQATGQLHRAEADHQPTCQAAQQP